jgi:hypothetical protein
MNKHTKHTKHTKHSHPDDPPVWFSTGCSTGIGHFAAIEEGNPAEVRKRRRGCIVNLSSLAGVRGMPALGEYNATKFAFEGALAKVDELRRDFVAGEVVARGADFPMVMP